MIQVHSTDFLVDRAKTLKLFEDMGTALQQDFLNFNVKLDAEIIKLEHMQNAHLLNDAGSYIGRLNTVKTEISTISVMARELHDKAKRETKRSGSAKCQKDINGDVRVYSTVAHLIFTMGVQELIPNIQIICELIRITNAPDSNAHVTQLHQTLEKMMENVSAVHSKFTQASDDLKALIAAPN